MVGLDEDALRGAIIALAAKYGRYGYRRITGLLPMAGKQRSGGTDLAAGRAKSAPETKGAREIVVERRLLRAAEAGAGKSCLELRLCQRNDARGQDDSCVDAESMNTRESAWRSEWSGDSGAKRGSRRCRM